MFEPTTIIDEPMSEIQHSKFQEDIFSFIENEKGSLIVDAKAGSGKTYTMCASMHRLPYPDDLILALAFNKSIATTLQNRVPSFVEARTFNSLGYGAVKREFNSDMLRSPNEKVMTILKKVVPNNYHEDYLYELCRVIHSGKAWGVSHYAPNDEIIWNQLLADTDQFDISEIFPRCIPWLIKAYQMSLEQTDVMDFSDQILFPLIYNIQGKKYDIIYVDEAQDLNPMQHDFIRHFLTPNGRVIAFGDPRQAIYGFRGADAKSMNKLSRMFNATSLPLSISYRCAQNIIKEAQSIEPTSSPGPLLLQPIVTGKP